MGSSIRKELAVDYVGLGDLRPDPFNPRRISEEELENLTRSVQQFGVVDPIIARRQDSVVIGGHQRLLAARRLGLRTVPVIYLDITTEQAKLLNLALNRISGDWDQELLARLLSELGDVPNVDLTLSGFADDEIKNLLRSLDAREKRDRPETFDLDAALEAAQASPGVERGDIWRLGDHSIMCGSATEDADVARLVGTQRASMAFMDPPYSVGYQGGATGKRRKILNDDLGPDFGAFLEAACRNLLAQTDGAVYICMSSSELHTLRQAFVAAGGHWSTFIVWVKSAFTLSRSDYQRQYEPLLYGWREGASHYWSGARDEGDAWLVDKPGANPLHPTQKPLELVERAIENSSRPGDIVLDLFLGSGTTLIAAERTGRVCYGLELDPHYCRIAIARWEAFTGLKAEKEGNTR